MGVTGGVIYTGALIGLNELWYKNYPRSRFHFFNDNAEWLQVDKVGHVFTPYFEGLWTYRSLRWAGVNKKKAAWYGGISGFAFQSVIEVLDGFSAQWGASSGDLLANAVGSGLFTSQQLLWQEQRFQLKFSFHTVKYEDDVKNRASDLYGSGLHERLLKDYNGQSYWLSGNIYSFLKKESKFPKWLNLAVGYSAEGLLGGHDNIWRNESGQVIDRSDITRYRQFFISPDVDLTKIETKSRVIRSLLFIFNAIKVPAPALEYNSLGRMKFHFVYF